MEFFLVSGLALDLLKKKQHFLLELIIIFAFVSLNVDINYLFFQQRSKEVIKTEIIDYTFNLCAGKV